MRNGRGLRGIVLALVAAGIVLPILAGFAHTLRAAVGVLPAIGASALSADPWRMLFATPGIAHSIGLSLVTGLGATALAVLIAFTATGALFARLDAAAWGRVLAPLLAVPHAALAIGLAFLIAPSGWIARLFSPWATGWTQPPDIAVVGDPCGLSLTLGLLVKEAPFLILVLLAALSRLPVHAQIAAARALGHSAAKAWVLIVLPQAYAMIRLPVLVVLSYGLSVVDMAIVLGPSHPPTLAVLMTRWMQDPDLARLLPASAAAILLAVMVAAAAALWRCAEIAVGHAARARIRSGGGTGSPALGLIGAGAFAAIAALGFLALGVLALWSVARSWRFPDAWPGTLSLHAWMGGWGASAATTLVVALFATLLSVALAIAWLEGEERGGYRRARWAEALIYLPLILPQVAFLHGLYMVQLGFGVAGGLLPVVWMHTIFVFPYVMIALSDPWRAVDRRLIASAAALGAGPWRRLWRVRLPALTAPLLSAAAIGFAVSVAQYLPTLFAGGGRVSTLTTEAIALSSGSDRRVTAVHAMLQALLPLLAYLAATAIPAIRFRDRRGMMSGLAR